MRQNTLTILTHLILNDMVKVKGQISDIALCITDDDPRISGELVLGINGVDFVCHGELYVELSPHGKCMLRCHSSKGSVGFCAFQDYIYLHY